MGNNGLCGWMLRSRRWLLVKGEEIKSTAGHARLRMRGYACEATHALRTVAGANVVVPLPNVCVHGGPHVPVTPADVSVDVQHPHQPFA
jgi:hypothetical protein